MTEHQGEEKMAPQMKARRSGSGSTKEKAQRHPRLPADPRPKALAQFEAVTGYIFRDHKTGTVYLLTSDRRKVIAELQPVTKYESPRHEHGTTMIMYRAMIGGEEFVGRSSGLVLTMRPRQGRGWR